MFEGRGHADDHNIANSDWIVLNCESQPSGRMAGHHLATFDKPRRTRIATERCDALWIWIDPNDRKTCSLCAQRKRQAHVTEAHDPNGALAAVNLAFKIQSVGILTKSHQVTGFKEVGVSMKAVILAGGLGTRLAEETEVRPKPMVEVGHRPLIWHILKHYSSFAINDFVVALGYKGDDIKRFFLDYRTLTGSLTISMKDGEVFHHEADKADPWTIELVETGSATQTGGRLGRLRNTIGKETFMLTYGDGLSNVDLDELLTYHRSHGRLATVTAVRPPARFGGLIFREGDEVTFTEKPQIGEGWINGGFMVLEPEVLDLVTGDDSNFERDVLERLADEGQLVGFRHEDFWQCIDTMRELRYVRDLWDKGEAPWALWS